jgi:hypothetical protein
VYRSYRAACEFIRDRRDACHRGRERVLVNDSLTVISESHSDLPTRRGVDIGEPLLRELIRDPRDACQHGRGRLLVKDTNQRIRHPSITT